MNVYWKEILLFEVTDLHKNVVMYSKTLNDIDECNSDLDRRINWAVDKAKALKGNDADDYIKNRIFWVVNEVYNECFKRMKNNWDPKLVAAGVESIPTDKDEYAELVFSQPNYKDRAARDAEVPEV